MWMWMGLGCFDLSSGFMFQFMYNDGHGHLQVTLKYTMENMAGEKRGSKGGRYVGGFSHLFDWNSKSRKRLFSSKNDSPEQVKRDEEILQQSRVRMVNEDGSHEVACIARGGGSDYSCASSVTDDEGYRTRAPSVVARLMGLDLLTSSNVTEPCSSPFSDTHSIRDAPPRMRKELEFLHDHQTMHSSNSLDKVEASARNSMEPKPPMTPSKPIEKFKAEILPPRSAKSIPITHHKLLSPIKTPGFIPSRDAAYIMEAAAKIIEPGRQATVRSKISSSGSSSVSFKVRELKEKLEASQKPSRLSGASERLADATSSKSLKVSSVEKNLNNSVNTMSFKFSSDTVGSSASLKSKGKSISLAIQAKVNVQRRDGINSSNRSLDELKEPEEVRPGQSSRSQHHCLNSAHKKSSARSASTVLRENNQKQNCSTDKDKLPSKSSVPNLRSRKSVAGSSVQGRQTTLSKEITRGYRKSSLGARDYDKEIQHSEVENVPRKKRSIDGDGKQQSDKSYVVDNTMSNASKPTQCTAVVDRHCTLVEERRKKGMDVVSFTFTFPLTRPVAGSGPSIQVDETFGSPAASHNKMIPMSDVRGSSSLGLDAIGSDAASILLEQKLRELTHGLENSSKNAIAGGSSSVRQNFVPADAGGSIPIVRNYWSVDSQVYPSFSLTKHEVARGIYMFQGGEDMDEYNRDRTEIDRLEGSCTPSPVSILVPSLLTESCCNSLGSTESDSALDSKRCSSAEIQKDCRFTSPTKDYSAEAEADLLDSASSTLSGNNTPALSVEGRFSARSSEWELEYVQDILCNVELMLKDYALGQRRGVIKPCLFDQLERRRNGCCRQTDDDKGRLERKIVFDCASECMELRGWKTMVGKKGRLAEEVYREIKGWRSMGKSKVDEVVDGDMSSRYGKWLEFEVEECAVCVEIEGEICGYLIDEVIADIFAI